MALCDVDWDRGAKSFKQFPRAKRFKDYRVMLDKMGDEIDAVIVATPDHTHAVATMEAMRRGKHVYTEKPLTHTIWEARQLTEAARKNGVATQMGNQGHSSEGARQTVEWIRAGVIGEVRAASGELALFRALRAPGGGCPSLRAASGPRTQLLGIARPGRGSLGHQVVVLQEHAQHQLLETSSGRERHAHGAAATAPAPRGTAPASPPSHTGRVPPCRSSQRRSGPRCATAPRLARAG